MGRLDAKPRSLCRGCGKLYESTRGYSVHLTKVPSCRDRVNQIRAAEIPQVTVEDEEGATSSQEEIAEDVDMAVDAPSTTGGEDSTRVDFDPDGKVDAALAASREYPMDVDPGLDKDTEDNMSHRDGVKGTWPPIPSDQADYRVEEYPGAGADFGPGKTFFQILQGPDPAEWTSARDKNLYWPFRDHIEWELAMWLAESKLPQERISSFLKLQFVRIFCLTSYSAVTDFGSRCKEFRQHTLLSRNT